MKVGDGIIPKEALAVLAVGFGRRVGDRWVEAIARSFLEAWPEAERNAATSIRIGGGDVELPERVTLPIRPLA